MKFAAQPQELRAAERLAKDARLRMFKNWVPPGEGPNALQDAEYEGTVVEVRSGDTVIIAKGDGQADTITLSSIRAPKLGNARRNAPYEPFSWEAREFVRNYIGKKHTYVLTALFPFRDVFSHFCRALAPLAQLLPEADCPAE